MALLALSKCGHLGDHDKSSEWNAKWDWSNAVQCSKGKMQTVRYMPTGPLPKVYINVTTLSGVSYASVYEQTHSRQCCNVFISLLWTQPVIVPPSGTTSNYSTPRLTARLPVLRVCAMFDELTEFCFVFRFGFRASFLDFISRIERLHFCYYYADVWSVLAYFCSEHSRAHPSTGRSGQVIDSVCKILCMSQFSWLA